MIYNENGLVIRLIIDGICEKDGQQVEAELLWNLVPSGEFTPIDELTEEQVMSWIDNYTILDKELERLYEDKYYPVIASGGFPWEV